MDNKNNKYYFLIPAVLVLIIYAYSLSFDLINLDDHHLVSQLEEVEEIEVALDLAFNEKYLAGAYFRPVVTLSVWFDLWISDGSVFFLHLTNVILHIISVIILYFLFLRLTGSAFLGLSGSSLYAVHPIFVNAVAWTLGRNDLLVGVFVFISFLMFMNSVREKKYIYLVLHIVFYLLAAFSKETGGVLPAVCFIYLLIYSRKELFTKQNITMAVGWILVFLIWYFLRSNAIGKSGEEIIGFGYFIDNIRIIPEFIGKFFIPADITVLPAFRTFNTVAGIVIIAIFSFFSIFIKDKKSDLLLFGIAWFFMFTVPGMFSKIFTDNDFFNYFDCRVYLPAFGLILIAYSIFAPSLKKYKEKTKYIFAAVIILLLIPVSIVEASYYKSPVKYWTKAVKEEPGKARYWYELGVNADRVNKHEAAEKFMLKATKLNDTRPEFYLSLGNMMKEIEDYKKAENYLLESIKRFPSWLSPKLELAEVFFIQEKYRSTINAINNIFEEHKVIPSLIPNLIKCYAFINEYEIAMNKIKYHSDKLNRKEISKLYNIIGVKAIEKEKESIALEAWQKALSYNKNNKMALMNLYNFWKLHSPDEEKAKYYENLIRQLEN